MENRFGNCWMTLRDDLLNFFILTEIWSTTLSMPGPLPLSILNCIIFEQFTIKIWRVFSYNVMHTYEECIRSWQKNLSKILRSSSLVCKWPNFGIRILVAIFWGKAWKHVKWVLTIFLSYCLGIAATVGKCYNILQGMVIGQALKLHEVCFRTKNTKRRSHHKVR